MKTVFSWLFWVDVFVVNIVLGYLVYKQIYTKPVSVSKSLVVDECGASCRAYIDMKMPPIVATSSPIVAVVPTKVVPDPTNTPVTPTIAKIRRVSYVTIPGTGGSSLEQSWIDVSGTDFYFDTKDYPGIKEVIFESTMQLVNGSGMAYVRLFDATHGIGVQGSEVQTNSNSITIVQSGQVGFWSGKNLIRVQIKSLTTESAVFNGGRLRIVAEN